MNWFEKKISSEKILVESLISINSESIKPGHKITAESIK